MKPIQSVRLVSKAIIVALCPHCDALYECRPACRIQRQSPDSVEWRVPKAICPACLREYDLALLATGNTRTQLARRLHGGRSQGRAGKCTI